MRQLHCPVPETPVMPSCYSPPPGRPGGGGSLVAVFVMLIFALLFSPSSMQPTDTDALTIFRLRADTHGILAANWTTPDACSGRWHGVRCVAVEGRSRVTSLSLPSLDLRGPLDPLASLSELRSLDLHDNRLNGTLDLSLTSLPNLKFLYLSHNDLTGAIPPALGLIVRRLVRLDLSDNNLRGPIPATLSNLAHLLTLRLQDNLLSGSLPDISTALPALMDLNVSNNELQGRVPDGMRTRFGDAPFSGNAGLCGSKPPLPACGAPVETGRVPSSPAPTTAVVPSNPSSMPGSPATVAGGGEDVRRRLSRGAIIGIATGNATLLLLLSSLLVAYCCCRRAPLEEEEDVEDGKEWGGDNAFGDKRSNCYYDQQQQQQQHSGQQWKGGREQESGAQGGQSKLVFFDSSDEGSRYSTEDRQVGRRKKRRTSASASSRSSNGHRQFDLEDLLRASAEMVGKGSLGTVYRAVVEERCVMAVKRLRDANPCPRREFEGYMDLIGRVRHPNLVPLRAYYYARQEKLLVYDYLPNGTLHTLIHGSRGQPSRSPLDWTTRLGLALGIARGLARIHQEKSTSSCSSSPDSSSSRIPHGNVSSSNVLLDKNGVARLSDFGLALLLDPVDATARLGAYRAPEQVDTKMLSQEADVYAFGVLLFELLTGRPPSQQYHVSPPLHEDMINNDPDDDDDVIKGGGGGEGCILSTNLPEWVRSVLREESAGEVFDVELLRYKKNVEDEMVAVLHIGLACVVQQPHHRPTMAEVVKLITGIRVEGLPLADEDLDNPRISLSPTTTATEEERCSC